MTAGSERWVWVQHRSTLSVQQVPLSTLPELDAAWEEISVDEALGIRDRAR